MIQHIMLWNYRDEVSAGERRRIEGELVRLPERVPALRRVEWGPVVGGRNQSFSHCFVMYFDDMDGLQEYVTHPDHIRFAGPFKEACALQVVVDFEESPKSKVQSPKFKVTKNLGLWTQSERGTE